MRNLRCTSAFVALIALVGGFGAGHAAMPSVAMAQEQDPSPAPTDTGSGMRAIIDRMEKRLTANVRGTSDRQYVATMAAISPAIVAACKHEIGTGSDRNVRATAQRILTVEQENEAYVREYAEKFHIDHSP